MSPGNVDSALLSNIVYRESFSEFKLTFKRLNSPSNLFGLVQTLKQPSEEDGRILVESLARRDRVGVGISLITGR